jgi:type VI protein secretion system component VasK
VPVEQLAPVSQRLLCAEQELFAAVVHEPFLQLQTLLQTPLGAGFGCAQYRERVGEVVDALERSQRGEPLLNLFNGRASDPLEAVWDATHRGLSGLDPQLAACLEGLLLKPLSAAGQVVAQELTQALNARWQEEVVTPFASRLAGRYPFDPRAEEAAYSDVMEFFRPGTGIFWGFYDRVLCGFVNKNGDAWQVRSGRCITLSLESGGQGTLERAERIGNLFFHPNGELRVLTLSIAASAGTAKVAQLVVDGQALDLLPGGAAQLFYWPRAVELRQGSLQVRIDERCVQGYNFGGPWGLVKLLGQARLSAPSPGTLDATWGVNVQNMYTVYQKYRLQVSGGEHPFGRTFFEGFDCPDKLVAAGAVPLK